MDRDCRGKGGVSRTREHSGLPQEGQCGLLACLCCPFQASCPLCVAAGVPFPCCATDSGLNQPSSLCWEHHSARPSSSWLCSVSVPGVMFKPVSVQAHVSCSKLPGLNPLLQANSSHLTPRSHGQLLLWVTCSKGKGEGNNFPVRHLGPFLLIMCNAPEPRSLTHGQGSHYSMLKELPFGGKLRSSV